MTLSHAHSYLASIEQRTTRPSGSVTCRVVGGLVVTAATRVGTMVSMDWTAAKIINEIQNEPDEWGTIYKWCMRVCTWLRGGAACQIC
jgi:hypothetical protein